MLRSGLIGRSIMASRSPWLHEREAQAQGFELGYRLFDFNELGLADTDLPALLSDLRAQGYCGVNITYPFKQAVIPLLDALDESAEMVGAVNTVAMHGGRLIGYNTDMSGFRDSLLDGLPGARLDHVLQLGAGGAGAAVSNALLSLGAGKLEIADVDFSRATALASRLSARFGAQRVAATDCSRIETAEVDGIVNTTPMGMAAKPGSPIAPELIAPRHWVADIVYFPLETELLRVARKRGCDVLDGSGMVVSQAAEAFGIFTGRSADHERMLRSFSEPAGK